MRRYTHQQIEAVELSEARRLTTKLNLSEVLSYSDRGRDVRDSAQRGRHGLTEYLLAAFGGDICETHLDVALAYFVCLVVWCCLRCCKVVAAAGW